MKHQWQRRLRIFIDIKKRFRREITMTVLQRQCTVIISMLGTLFLAKMWPRFLNDALTFPWYLYVLLIVGFAVPLFRLK